MAALSYSIDTGRGIVTLTYHTQPTFEEWRDVMYDVMADPAYRPGMALLGDRRHLVGDVPLSTATVKRMAEFLGQTRGGFRQWAVLLLPTQLGEYGMTRMWGMLMERHNVTLRAFTDLDVAMAWLRQSQRGSDT